MRGKAHPARAVSVRLSSPDVRQAQVKKANIELHAIESHFYDGVHFEIFNETEQQHIDQTFAELRKRLPARGTCLDMGCGTGNIARRENEIFDWVIGFDISRHMLLEAKRRVRSLSLVCGDCENLPFKGGTFDFVSMYLTLHHLPNHARKISDNLWGRKANQSILVRRRRHSGTCRRWILEKEHESDYQPGQHGGSVN